MCNNLLVVEMLFEIQKLRQTSRYIQTTFLHLGSYSATNTITRALFLNYIYMWSTFTLKNIVHVFFYYIDSSYYGDPCFPQWVDFQRMSRLGVSRYHCLLEGILLFEIFCKIWNEQVLTFKSGYNFDTLVSLFIKNELLRVFFSFFRKYQENFKMENWQNTYLHLEIDTRK